MSEQSTESNEPIEQNESNFDSSEQSMVDQALAENAEEKTVEQRLAEAERNVLMAQAEMENFRKRMQRESDQLLKYANLPLVRDLLDIIDNLNRASDSAKSEAAKSDASKSETSQALLAGVAMVTQQFTTVLAKYGCKPIESTGKQFDPNIHQAISQMPSAEHAAGTVANEVAVGYMLHDRVVRPSCVIVSTGAPAN
jgi:molecular chaperone GrpE